MDWFLDALLTAAGVLALGGVLGLLMGRLLCPMPRTGVRVVLSGKGEDLERSLRALIWLRSVGLLNCPVVIDGRNLDGEGREIARRLAARWPGVFLQNEKD